MMHLLSAKVDFLAMCMGAQLLCMWQAEVAR